MSVPGNWTLNYDWGCGGNYDSTSFAVNANGTFTDGQGHSGVWVQAAGMFTFKYNNLNTTYSGNLASKSITGIQSTFGGLNGCFYMLQAGVPAEAKEVREKGTPDASGKK